MKALRMCSVFPQLTKGNTHVTSIDPKYINVQEHYLTVISLTEDKACAFDSGNKNTRSKTIYNYL